jgi:hypothetical protein
MDHYVTLFDSLFLPQGLALQRSLERHAGSYTLWVLCMDEGSETALERLALPNVRLLPLREAESEALLEVKPTRTTGEYCWTLTPFTPELVFAADLMPDEVTYVDADIWLMDSPRPILKSLARSGKSVQITDHGYAPEYDQSAASGRYCVQFMTFRRGSSEHVLRWWQERCLEWCHAYLEDGKFGDQKYLDDWPSRYPEDVHVLEEQGWTLAPWNATRFPYSSGLLYHFHGLRLLSDRRVRIGPYRIPAPLLENVYRPYLSDLRLAVTDLASIGVSAQPQAPRGGRAAASRLRDALLPTPAARSRWALRF